MEQRRRMRAPPLLLATGLSLATAATKKVALNTKTRASSQAQIAAAVTPAVCPDTSVCPPQPRTVLAIEGGDAGAAFATLYYLYVVNGVQYAWHKGYVPYIVFNATWMQQTMGTAAADAPPLGALLPQLLPGRGPVAGAVLQRRCRAPAAGLAGRAGARGIQVVGEGMVLRQSRARAVQPRGMVQVVPRAGLPIVAQHGERRRVARASSQSSRRRSSRRGVGVDHGPLRSLRVARRPPSRLGQGHRPTLHRHRGVGAVCGFVL